MHIAYTRTLGLTRPPLFISFTKKPTIFLDHTFNIDLLGKVFSKNIITGNTSNCFLYIFESKTSNVVHNISVQLSNMCMFRPGQQNFRDSNSKFQISTLEMFTAHKGFWFHIPFSNLVDLFSPFFPKCLEAFFCNLYWLLQPDLQLGTQHLRPMIGVQQYIKYFCHKQCKYTQPL